MTITPAPALACTMWVGALVAAPVVAGGCEACHGDPGLLVKDRKPYDDYQDWLASPHRQAGVTCEDILREGCMHCRQGERGRPGPGVIDRAGEVLHRLNVARGLLGWTSLHFERAGG